MTIINVNKQDLVNACVNFLSNMQHPAIDIQYESEDSYCGLSETLDAYFNTLNLPFMVNLNYDVLESIALNFNKHLA